MNIQIAYLATVTDLYGTVTYRQGQARALRRWPGAAWIESARMGWDVETWLAEWPGIVTTLSLLVVIPRDDLTIGRGVWREVTDCASMLIPTYVLLGGRWIRRFQLERMPGESFRYWGRVARDGSNQ